MTREEANKICKELMDGLTAEDKVPYVDIHLINGVRLSGHLLDWNSKELANIGCAMYHKKHGAQLVSAQAVATIALACEGNDNIGNR